MSTPPTRPKLDLFALYSLTTWLFALIAGVILAAVAASFRQNPSVLGFMIAAGMVVLPLRAFLLAPEKRFRSLGLPLYETETPPAHLVQEVNTAAHDLGMRRPPRLRVASHSVAPTTVGTWRRHYVIMGQPQIDRLSTHPAATRRALWLHEIGHFVNGDAWKVGLSQSLLQASITFMTWSAFFLLGILLLTLIYGLEIFEPGYLDTLSLAPTQRDLFASIWPDPASTAPLLEKARAIDPGMAALYVMNGHLPFAFSGVVLLLFVWRWLVQVREFYADARVATVIGDTPTVRSALLTINDDLTGLPTKVPGRSFGWLPNLRQWSNRLIPFSPTWEKRIACLQRPLEVFGSWKWGGAVAGIVVLVLDVVLAGPFTLSYVGSKPAHFATLAGFIILALWLLPSICQGFAKDRRIVGQMLGATSIFMGIRAGWLLFNTMLLLALYISDPNAVRELLETTIFLGNKVLASSSAWSLLEDPATLVPWVIGGIWGFVALVLVSLFAFLLLAWILFRWLLTWYAYPAAERRLIRVAWAIVVMLALTLSLIVLPLPTAIIQGDLASALQPASLIVTGVALSVVVGWVLWFLLANRRFGRRCPTCDGSVPGWFELGKKCPVCGQTLHPWLLADY